MHDPASGDARAAVPPPRAIARGVLEIDTLLGCVLAYSDEMFNEALKIGFASAIQREWAWREKRGESLANLRPFADLVDQNHRNEQKKSPA